MEVRSIKISEESLGRSKNHCKFLPASLYPLVLPKKKKKSHFSKLTLNSNTKKPPKRSELYSTYHPNCILDCTSLKC